MIINCTKNLPFYHEDTTNIRIPVDDLPDDRNRKIMLTHWTNDLFDSVLNHIMSGQNVLVHCQMGRQRSAATIAAFLMKNDMSMEDAIKHIRAKKREAFFPAINFKQALVDFRTKLDVKLFPRYENLNPIELADVPLFFEKEFDSFFESLTGKTYPLNKISTYLTFPYGEKNYVISMCVDLVTKKYTLSVVIPNTDMFLPIKNDVASIQKAINHIMTDNIQLYNSDTKDRLSST